MSTVMWVWLSGLLTVFIFSFVYQENPLYRFAEHLYVGTAAGYALSINFGYIKTLGVEPLMKQGKFSLIFPLVLGLMLFTRYFKSVAYFSRWAMAFQIGIGTGLSLYGIADAQLLKQITATFVPLFVSKNGSIQALPTINNIIMVVGVLGVLVYFFFSGKQQKGIAKSGAVFGRWVMMVTFGVSFGNVVMGRISLMLGSLQPILKDMLHLMK